MLWELLAAKKHAITVTLTSHVFRILRVQSTEKSEGIMGSNAFDPNIIVLQYHNLFTFATFNFINYGIKDFILAASVNDIYGNMMFLYNKIW